MTLEKFSGSRRDLGDDRRPSFSIASILSLKFIVFDYKSGEKFDLKFRNRKHSDLVELLVLFLEICNHPCICQMSCVKV